MSKLIELINAGYKAVDHVAYANYPEREREAVGWIDKAAREAQMESVQANLIIDRMTERLAEAERIINMINNEPRLYDTIKSLASKYAKKHRAS